MKKLILEIEYDDTGCYVPDEEKTTAELIKEAAEMEIEVGLEHDGVIKPGWTIKLIED